MPALSFLDLAMFLFESPERHFNVGPLIVLDPPSRLRATFAERLHARMLERPAGAPFTLRLSGPVLGLPSLEEDPDFDLSRHVHRVTLKAPGNQKRLFEQVSTLHQKPLDRTRPLWELYVIDGLEDGRVAVFGKMHHGVIDGRTFVQVISKWLAVSPKERTVRAMWESLPRRATHDAAQVSIVDRLRVGLGQAGGTATSVVSLYRMLADQALGSNGVGSRDTMPLPFTAIPKVLQGPASTKRSYAYCTLPVTQMKALAKAHGSSLNDLLLLTLDVALDRYLEELGTRPDKPLITAMPIALEGAKGGNQIAVLQFPLGTPGKSAAARLADIRRHTATVKDVVKREANSTLMLLTTLVHGVPSVLEKLGMKGGVTVSNMLVSNPFGFAEKRYLMGATVDLVLPVSIINAGQTLNVTAVTLGEHLQLGFLAIPGAVPKVHKLAQYTREVFDTLQTALSVPATSSPVKRTVRSRSAAPAKLTEATRRVPRQGKQPAAGPGR